jgi:hypothetical protein
MTPTYLDKDAYNQLIETLLTVPELLKVKPSPWSGKITAREISVALGTKANIWPTQDQPESSCAPNRGLPLVSRISTLDAMNITDPLN